ncbi:MULTISPECIES: serine hydrolase [unclassified Lysobacter]
MRTSLLNAPVIVTRTLLRLAAAALVATLVGACASTASTTASNASTPQLSPAQTHAEAGLVDIRSLVPDMVQEIRYAGSENFVGVPIDGYEAPRCYLLEPVAEALQKVEQDLRQQDLRLKIFDCYRPTRAVAHFVRWANDPDDVRNKADYYPDMDKPNLLNGYIAAVSGHSRGATVDLTLLQCETCEPLDMGTGFDFFGPIANTDSSLATPAQRANRERLREAMERHGFANYPMEWWHYTLRPEPSPTLMFDVPVSQPTADQLMGRYDGDVPGASLLVIKDGQPVVRRGYGLSDLESGTEAGPTTNYRLASVSKQFTAAAILLLAEDGTLDLDDPLRQWLPSLPDAADGITLHHVLSHTSGLIDYEDLLHDGMIPENTTGQVHDADVLHLLEGQDQTYFEPGTDYRYSNSGYALLALIVERASGLDYPAFLRERIFLPLGMHDTLAYVQGGPEVPNRAFGYSQVDGQWTRTDQSQTSAVLGDGGIYSSIDDLAKWDAALYDDRLLSDESRRLAFTAATPTDDPAVEYGYGWRITDDSLWHSGETMGFRNVIVRYPQQRLTVVLLSNRNDPEPYSTALEIAELFKR